MPSGAKKRKAAKRRKEQGQQQQLGGVHHPGSPTSTTTESSTPPQGNGPREEDDPTSHDSKGSDSGSDIASPTSQGNHHHHHRHRHHHHHHHLHHHHLEIGEEAQSDAKVEAKSEDSRKESGSSGSVDSELIHRTVNDGEEIASRPSTPQKEEETAKETGEKVAISAADVDKDKIALLPPSNPVLSTSVEVPIPEPEAVSTEHVLSGKDNDASVSREVPSLDLDQSEASDTGDLAEQPVRIPISEEVVRATDVPLESLGVVDNVSVAPSSNNKEKLVPLTDTRSRELDPTVENTHPGSGSYKTTRSSEVIRSVHVEQRASWLNCCGLFDVIASANK